MKYILIILLFATFTLTSCNNNKKEDMDTSNQNKLTKQNDQLSIKIVRQFDVSPEVVFDTFTKPEDMRSWWTEDTVFEIDLRVGGKWTITRYEGEELQLATGEYLEIEKPYKLKYTFAMPQYSPNSDTIAIQIVPAEEKGCIMTFIHSGVDIANELSGLPEDTVTDIEKGWQYGFDLMVEAWKKK